MFKNYIRNPRSKSPINLGFARIITSIYLIWKLLSISWGRIAEFPVLMPTPEPLLVGTIVQNAVVVQWVAVGLLVFFGIGLYTRVSAFLLSISVAYLGVTLASVNTSGLAQSFFLWAILLLLFALYAEQDRFSADGIRERSEAGIESLNEHLKSSPSPVYRQTPLAAFLAVFSTIYFGSGVAKIVVGGPGWISATNLGRYMTPPAGFAPAIGELVIQYDLLVTIAAAATILLEVGFIVVVFTGILFSPFVLALIGFHTSIALVMGPIFLDFVLFLVLFLDWEGAVSKFERTNRIDLVYDERCFFCAQSLYLFKYLDVNDSVRFYSQSDAPADYTIRTDVELSEAMYLFRDGEAHRGYHAFRELCNHLGLLRPLGAVMAVTPVAAVGKRVYQYIAANRSRHFTCAVESGAD